MKSFIELEFANGGRTTSFRRPSDGRIVLITEFTERVNHGSIDSERRIRHIATSYGSYAQNEHARFRRSGHLLFI